MCRSDDIKTCSRTESQPNFTPRGRFRRQNHAGMLMGPLICWVCVAYSSLEAIANNLGKLV